MGKAQSFPEKESRRSLKKTIENFVPKPEESGENPFLGHLKAYKEKGKENQSDLLLILLLYLFSFSFASFKTLLQQNIAITSLNKIKLRTIK